MPNPSTDVVQVARPGSSAWVPDGPPSGGLRWSIMIASTTTGDHAVSPDVGAVSGGMSAASRGGILHNPFVTVCPRHRGSSHLIRAANACTPRVRSEVTHG